MVEGEGLINGTETILVAPSKTISFTFHLSPIYILYLSTSSNGFFTAFFGRLFTSIFPLGHDHKASTLEFLVEGMVLDVSAKGLHACEHCVMLAIPPLAHQVFCCLG